MAREPDAERFLRSLEPVRDALYRFAARNVWRKDQAADVVQEAVMTAWSQFDRFQAGSNFRAWMFKIVLNTLYRVNRKTNRAREVRGDTETFDARGVLDDASAWASVLDDPERLREALDERLVAALDALGDTERHCLLLRLLEDFSYKEIAEQLDLPIGTVMSHVFRARMKLRERLAALAPRGGLVK